MDEKNVIMIIIRLGTLEGDSVILNMTLNLGQKFNLLYLKLLQFLMVGTITTDMVITSSVNYIICCKF